MIYPDNKSIQIGQYVNKIPKGHGIIKIGEYVKIDKFEENIDVIIQEFKKFETLITSSRELYILEK